MQTFLPYPDLKRSVCCLDPKRLGNQVYRECKVLITGGWPNHPASKMWRGYEGALANYALFGLEELWRRGLKYPHHFEFFEQFIGDELPPWFGDERLHASHRAALLSKNFNWYSQFSWSEQPMIQINGRWPYFWPVYYGLLETRN